MDSAALTSLQAPLEDACRGNPGAALVTLRARGAVGEGEITCKVETGRAVAEAGLHPAGPVRNCSPATCCWRHWPPVPA